MMLERLSARRPTRETALIALLIAMALIVLTLVLLAGAAADDAQRAEQAAANALAADRSLVEMRLALVESPPSVERVRAAFAAARGELAEDAAALNALEGLRAWTETPPRIDAASLAAWAALRRTLATRALDAEQAARRQGQQARGITMTASILLVTLTIGTIVLIVAEMRRRRRLAQSLEREANHDPLTLLPNRRFFLEWMSYALAQARREGSRVALLYIDLDGFKAVNDHHGHRRGDAVLAALAERLRFTKREGDLLARLGGDEFALAVPNVRDGRELVALAERLLASLVEPQPKLAEVPIGASIGIAYAPDDADDVPGLIAAADAAMYAAKRSGGQRATFFADTAV